MWCSDRNKLLGWLQAVRKHHGYILAVMKHTPVEIELGGKTRTLRFDLNALRGVNLQGYDATVFNKLVGSDKLVNYDVLLITLWAFLLSDAEDKAEKDFTPAMVGKWVDVSMVPDCIQAITQVVVQTAQNVKKDEQDAPPDTEQQSPLA